ncbi:hypothetical protein ACUOFC_42945, partial [Escherichia sp. TWPC-MK]
YDSGAAVGWAPLPPEESTQQQNQTLRCVRLQSPRSSNPDE